MTCLLHHELVVAHIRQEKYGQIVLPSIAVGLDGQVSEELCASAATMANHLNARAIFVYTRRGYMANFLSRCRPDCPIFAFTGTACLIPVPTQGIRAERHFA